MTIGKIKDLTQKEAPKPSRWDAHDSPTVEAPVAPAARVLPAKYQQGAERLAQAEANIARVLDGASPELFAAVVQTACCDSYFTPDERLGIDDGCKAYVFWLTKLRRQMEQK